MDPSFEMIEVFVIVRDRLLAPEGKKLVARPCLVIDTLSGRLDLLWNADPLFLVLFLLNLGCGLVTLRHELL